MRSGSLLLELQHLSVRFTALRIPRSALGSCG